MKSANKIDYAPSRYRRRLSANSIASMTTSLFCLGMAAFVQFPDFAYTFRDWVVWQACRYYGWLAAVPPLLLILVGMFVRRNRVANFIAFFITMGALVWWAQPILFK
jgi:hypothetical protein